MSSIPTKQIDGDVSVGRNVNVGGKADIKGSVSVGHNLKVEGWLDAKNIKGANKGVFTDITKLRETYPDGTLPDGSWAIVGGTLPGELWYVNGGSWVDSGKTAGSVTVDVEQYLEEVQTMSGDIETMKSDIDTIKKKNDTQDNILSTAQNGITANTGLIGKLSTDLSSEQKSRADADTTLQGKIDAEAKARADADNSMQTTLQGKIDAEAKARADAVTLLQGNIDALAQSGYRFLGIATPDTDPGTLSTNVFYIATQAGTYSHFGTGIMIAKEGVSSSEETKISVSEGDVAFLTYSGYVSPSSEKPTSVRGWSKSVLDLSDAVVKIVKERLAGIEDGVAPLGSNGLVPEDYLPDIPSEVVWIDVWVKPGDSVPTAGAGGNNRYYDETTGKLYSAKLTSGVGAEKLTWAWEEESITDTVIYVDRANNLSYRYDTTKSKLVAISAKASAASIYNPTVENDGRTYVLCDTENTSNSALHVAKRNGKAALGLMITFALKKGTWKTYQYIGMSTDDTYWYDTDNWKDFGSMVQGSEAVIDLDTIIPLQTGYYTLGTALNALKTYQESTGVNYQKRGLVISYSTEANKVETKQYQGDSALTDDFWIADLWQDFGGGSKVKTSDTMEDGGQDAFSTGGAYKAVPTEIEAEESEGSVALRLKSKGGDVLSETQFAVGTGSGSTGGTTVAINFEDDPFYVRAGGTAILKAAIRSVTQLADGSSQDNKIASVVFTNRTTKTVVASFKPNQASSSSLKAFNFEFDLTSIAANAGSTELQAVATDATGKTATRNVELIAVDVTVESSQTLNYTKDTSLQVGGQKVSIPMYRFPHNASDKGIQTKIEIYKSGAWNTLEDVLVKDTYTHNVTIDPTGMGHGAYPLRIQGTDVASGLTGNVLHTAVMVIEQRESVSDYNKPIVVARWYDDNGGKVKLFQTVSFDVACYQRDNANPTVEVSVTDVTKKSTESIANKTMNRSSYYTIEKRIVGYSDGDELSFDAAAQQQPTEPSGNGAATEQGGTATTVGLVEKPTFDINGSLLSIAETEGAYYKISLAGRSNSDTDKSIKTTASDGSAVGITVHGSNYSTNGFVADNFGTEQTEGRMALRVAENVTAECTDKPFASNAIPTNGMALSLTFMVKNIAKRDAQIIKCMSDKLGFVLTGEKFIVSTNGDSTDALKNVMTTAATSYLDGTVYRIDIVIEPQARAPYSGIMLCKVFQNGDESASVPIDTSNGFPTFEDIIHFDGTDADLYLYEITRWNSYYDFIQAFNNYIVNLTDTQAMLTEYEQNNVMTDVTAEGTTKPRPDMQKLLDRGIMVCVMTRTSDKNLSKDGSAVTDSKIYYPDYIESLKDKKTSVLEDWYLYFPDRPWANCKVEAVPVTNQGTSTLAYAVKNKKAKFKKAKKITLLYTREQISEMYNGDETILAKYDDAAKLAAKKKIRIKEGSTPVNTITVKVDYSDSAGANNCALMEQMNDTQMALGTDYITPSQRYNTNKSEELHSSIDGVTCALFRTDYKIGQDKGAEAATLPENAYFHSKGNFNADKGNPHFFGFEDVEGYNLGCVNYGDFKEIVTPRGTDIDDYKATVLSNPGSLVPGTLYMISEFCGPKTRFIENDGTGSMTEIDAVAVDDEHILGKTLAEMQADDVNNYDWGEAYKTSDGKFVQYKGGKWKDTTGSMTFDTATQKWSIVGRVLNPVECYEYRQYQEFCWQQGVNSVDDMLKTLHTDDGDVPVWSTYYEMRYPDDDDLNALYASGQKVPYQLYRELAFCQQCNQNLTDDATQNAAKKADGSEAVFNGAGASTTITLDGKSVPGTKENRLKKWQHEMHNYFSPQSTNCYIVASDYKATVDQRAKNMMAAVYLEADGKMRFYFNHWYDGDSCDEADNDCYLTIPWDMDGASSHLYQGWDGVMFQQSYALFAKGEGVWTDDSGKSVLTLHDTAAAMRGTKTSTGLDIFSADGCYRYWMTNRILKWPKVVSSFDGERKYIETATAADNHYPALHGLRLDSLPAFQRKRFAYRDGYFQTGDLFKKFFQARMMGPITVKITAAQDGYFGMGVDSTSSAKYACYLKAGESHTFSDAAAGEGGKLIYIFGADKIGTLDLSGCTPKNSNWMIADCTLLRKLIIGGTDYAPAYTTDILSALSLGQMPFLEEIDIRNTKILTLNASGCPRLKSVLAEGSLLQTFNVAEASPIETLHLPASMTDLRFVNLPKLSYVKGGGMTIEGFANVKTLTVNGCPNIDGVSLLTDVVNGGATLTGVSIAGIRTISEASVLQSLKSAGTIGLNSEDKTVCDGLSGQWTMKKYTDEDVISDLQSYFVNLTIRQQLYTDYVIFDNTKSQKSIYNTDNGTGYVDENTYTTYQPSGHILNIRKRCKGVRGTYNSETHKMHMELLSDSDYTKLADGVTDSDIKDSLGKMYDFFQFIPHYWYKGVNDYKTQKKHILLNTWKNMPESTASKTLQPKLSECLYKDTYGLMDANVSVGNVLGDNCFGVLTACATYRMDVEGMRQVRYIGLNNATVCSVFTDADGKILQKDVFSASGIAESPLDFSNERGDYLFRDVPTTAKYFYFTCLRNLDDESHMILSTDSTDLEAIEPGWVEHKAGLIGLKTMTTDDLGYARSISGRTTRCGDGTSVTSTEWNYDADGNPTNMPVSTPHYTYQDMLNLCRYRGKGYHSISYEQSKDMAILSLCWCGQKDDQSYYGYGCEPWYTTGQRDNMGNSDTKGVNNTPNLVWGLEGFIACTYEVMDYIGMNIPNFKAWKAAKRTDGNMGDVTNGLMHIYDEYTDTERTVQAITTTGLCISRIVLGRHCDVIASSGYSNGKWDTCYCAAFWYSDAKGRCVGRSGGNANAHGGLVDAGADNGSADSDSGSGVRLAFTGVLENESEIDPTQSEAA